VRTIILAASAAALAALAGCGFIETGHVGVRSQFGNVQMQEEGPGFYTALLSSVGEFSGSKEVAIDLNDLKPKAKDNLSLQDLDVTVFFTTAPAATAEVLVKYTGQAYKVGGVWVAGYGVVERQARSSIYDEVAKHDSLVMHTVRQDMETAILGSLQKTLNETDPGVFTVTKVIIRSVTTDQSIEASIRSAVQAQKELEQKSTQVEIAKKEAEVTVAKAKGIAESQRIINATLTREYLQHEQNEAMLAFAKGGNSTTVLFPYGSSVAPMVNLK
jgi:regulator of protease activity HflC (stomatin/prohibitin superfamily)